MWVEHLQGVEIEREGERMEHIQGRLDAESTSRGVEHLQGLKREGPTIEIVWTDRTQHMQGLLYIGSAIDVVEYKRS